MAAVFMSLFLLNLLFSGSSNTDAQRPRNSTLHRLTRHLLLNYSKGVRPVRNWSKATTVYLDLFVHAVLDVNTQNQKLTTSIWFRQMWKDEFLTWNSSLYDGIREISLPLSTLWSPDIVINEFVDVSRSPDLPYVYVNAAGMIKNYKPMQVVSACSLEAYAFPFDTQNCSLTFSSILHTVEDVDLTFWRSREDIKNDKTLFLDDGEWELLSVPSHPRVLHMETGRFAQIQFNRFVLGFRVIESITSTWAVLCFTFSLTRDMLQFLAIDGFFLVGIVFSSRALTPKGFDLKVSGSFRSILAMVVIRRRPLLYVVSLLIPSLFLMVIDLASFYLPPNCGTRITFKTSVLVGYTVFKVNMSDKLPGTAVSTPLIGVFFTVCMALLVLSLSKSILLVKFLHLGEDPVRERLFSGCWVSSAVVGGGPGERPQAPRLQAAGDIAGLSLCGEQEEGKGEGPWKVTRAQKAPMEKILAELLLISSQLRALDWASRLEVNWLTLSYRLDRLLFWVYVLTLGVYSVTLCSLWVVWSAQ